jgi:hypothetical protein
MFSLGGFAMVLSAIVISMLFGSSGGQLRAISVPIIEEIAFLAPAVFALWKRRAAATVMGASDVFLLFVVSGCGFALVEEACMRAKGDWGTAPIPFLPGCIVVGNRIFGEHLSNSQYIWAGLAGATIAFALLMRHRKKLAWQIALSGVVVGLIDHAVNNLRADARSSGLAGNFFLAPFALVMLNGYLLPLLFMAAVIAVVAVDLKLIRSLPGSFKQESTGTLLQRWQTALDLRRMAYANYYCQHLSGAEKEQSETMVGFCFFRAWSRNKAPKEVVAG